MSAEIGRHLKRVKAQRKILNQYRAYEKQIDELNYQAKKRELAKHSTIFETLNYVEPPLTVHLITQYETNLDLAENRLKAAAAKGTVVDITSTKLAQDLQCVKAPSRTNNPLEEKLRIRRNLVRYDFYERFKHIPQVETYKLTILNLKPVEQDDSIADLSLFLQTPIYLPVVLLSFKDPADALLYQMAIL